MKPAFIVMLLIHSLMIFSCHKDDDKTPELETGTVTDQDGNIYTTVKIGSQWWMAENLKTKHYRNGQQLPEISDSASWASRIIGAYAIYENGNTQSAAPGLLYNAFAISDTGGIAPQGWHVPTDEDWKTLERNIGLSADDAERQGWRGTHEGEKLKAASPEGWSAYENIWSTNESGFDALAGGCRLPDARYGQPGLFCTGFWWTASAYNDGEAWYRYLDYKNSAIFRSHDSDKYGFSIRCVKD